MNLDHVSKLQVALKHIMEGRTVQFKSRVHPNDWIDCTSVFTLADCIRSDYELRVKPEPVFKEVALFQTTSILIYSAVRDAQVPPSWKRVSDWVKVEIKDVHHETQSS